MSYRIGIDVGGTHTDAVLLDADYKVISQVKSPTTPDVSDGIYQAMRKVIAHSNVAVDNIQYAMLGTTHCTNAIVERKHLNTVAVIRIGAPASLAIKPLVGFPEDLKETLGQFIYLVRGGHEFDGREITELDEAHLIQIAQELKGRVNSVAITSIFSPLTNEHEQRAASIIREALGDTVSISLSHEIGSVGLLERENATVLNAAIVDVAKATANGFLHALEREGIQAQVFFGQNDGTLMSVEYTTKYPILTIACGPTNSLRGASFLTDRKNAIVVDVGGTTTDIGVLVDSFPRQSSLAVELGGVRTNFRMPDIISIGLGGGTIIHLMEDGKFQIGPESVGYQLKEKSLIFGGSVLTTTDVAVGLGKVHLGNPQLVSHLNSTLLEKIYRNMIELIEEAIDKMKTDQKPVPVVLVGGGSILLPTTLQGASDVFKPESFGVANAIGCAIAQVSGQIEKIFSLQELGREETLEVAKNMAYEEAIKAGARPDQLFMVDFEEIPLSYLPGNVVKIRAKAAGPLLTAQTSV